jgi:hypothetical protein
LKDVCIKNDVDLEVMMNLHFQNVIWSFMYVMIYTRLNGFTIAW